MIAAARLRGRALCRLSVGGLQQKLLLATTTDQQKVRSNVLDFASTWHRHLTQPTSSRPFSSSVAPSTRRRRTRRSSRFGIEEELARGAPQQPAALSNLADDERLKSQLTDLLHNATIRPNTQTTLSAADQPFDPDMPIDEYLQLASLSPWVPCPDAVARRMLDIAQLGEDDVHYDLGCGDGRVNFHALDVYRAKRTVGVDVDPKLVGMAQDRLNKRHPPPANIEFITADLLDSDDIWNQIGSDATVITCYFVEEALQKIKPMLEQHCGGSGIKVVTCGYEMKGWQAKWAEVVLGLPVHMYVLHDEEEAPPSIEEMRAAAMSNMSEVAEAAAMAAERDGGGWKSAEDTIPEPEVPDYFFDPEERIDGAWDNFDETDEALREIEVEENARGTSSGKGNGGSKK